MAEQMITKQCCTCKEIKDTSKFNRNKSKKDGLSEMCKKCNAVCQKKYKESKKGRVTDTAYQNRFYLRHPLKKRARCAVAYAVKTGKIASANLLKCSICNKKAEEYHHVDYSIDRWFDIVPVCKLCHRHIHSTGPCAPSVE